MPTHETRAEWTEGERQCVALAVLEDDGWTEYNVCLPAEEADPDALAAAAWALRNAQRGE